MKTMIIFMGCIPRPTPCHSQHLLTLRFSFSSFQNHLRMLCKRSARVGHLFRRENLGSEHGLFLAAILQDFLDFKSSARAEIFFVVLHVVWGPCVPHYPITMINHGKCLLIIHNLLSNVIFPKFWCTKGQSDYMVRQTVNKHIIKLSFWLNFRIDESNPSSLQNPLVSLSSSQKEKKMDKEKTKERYLVFSAFVSH